MPSHNHKRARSARGELVDFDVITIKQQLASNPVPVDVDQRRQFIDKKNGPRTVKKNLELEQKPIVVSQNSPSDDELE